MTENKRSEAFVWIDPTDAPDLSTPGYQARLAAAAVRPGRAKSVAPSRVEAVVRRNVVAETTPDSSGKR